jgi:hypothetical protein
MTHSLRISFAIAALGTLAAADAGAEPRWSGYAHVGNVVTTGSREAGSILHLSPGGWAGVLHRVGAIVSVGGELGYHRLPGVEYLLSDVVIRTSTSSDFTVLSLTDFSLLSGSGVVRVRWLAGPELLGTFGYYDLMRRNHYIDYFRQELPIERVVHERRPGMSLAVGASGSGPVGPGLRFRWHHVFRTRTDDPRPFQTDVVSFELGLHFY